MSPVQQDRLLRLTAVAKQELDASGAALALVARNGTNLQRFGLRYSHAGISLKASRNGAWSVRQLYYACDEGRPRLYDQGLAGFAFGINDADRAQLSLLLLPPEQAATLERAALDDARASRLLAAQYSANAYAFSTAFQNCNQWVMELLAVAWGGLADAPDLRGQAQQWLRSQGFDPAPVDVGSHWLMAAAPFIPLLHLSDHPLDDRISLRLRTSVPASIEGFVRAHVPGAMRIELCHDGQRVVVRRGWDPITDGCVPREGDRVVPFD